MMTKSLLLTVLLAAGAAWAQEPPGGGPGPGMQPPPGPPGPPPGDIMMENFVPPELVMQHQKAIGLKEDQLSAIRGEMQKVLQKVTELQWQQSAEAESLAALVKQERIDEKEVLSHLDKLLSIENQIKHEHIALLIKVKNTLTPEQQDQLRELKRQMRPRPSGFGPGPGRMHRGGPISQDQPPTPPEGPVQE